jgi:type IV secretory pathway VirB9-like protein
MKNKLVAFVLALTAVLPLYADSSARTILYHSKDIVNIRAKVKYTTLIQLPTTEKIIEAATGDKEFWIIDVVGSYCFVHPAKKDIRSNLNLITDKGNIYSFTLEDTTDQPGDPDLKVIVQPSDQSAIVASSGPAQYVPATQVMAMESQLQGLQSHVTQVVDEYKAAYPTELKFDYAFAVGKAPFNVTAIYHDAKFTYIKSDTTEKFAVYELRDGSPNIVNYELRNGTYIIAKVLDAGYFEVGKKKMEFTRKVQP